MTTTTLVAAPTVALVRRSARVRALWLLALLVLLAGACVASLAVGSRQVPWADVVAALGGARDGIDHAAVGVRVPRTVLAALVGAALGLAGAVMQGVTRNPLADPGILGVTTGASLAVVVGIAWFGLTAATSKVWVASVGAGLTAVFVYVVGSLGRGGATPLKLALAGAATSAALSSFIAGVVLGRNDISGTVRSWQVGGVGGATFATMTPVLPFLGVGLVVPHACRLLVGPSHRWLLPFSALGGACLLLLGDVVGRVIARPEEIAVGIITAIVGAPFFIAIVRRRKVREL